MRSLIAATLIAACAADVGYDIVTPTGYTRLRSGKFNGTLYSVDVSSKYDLAPSLLDLYGTYYQQGFDAGFVLGNEMKEGYGELLMKFLGNSTLEPLEAEVIGLLADWQYNDVLSVQLPQEYKDEIRWVKHQVFEPHNSVRTAESMMERLQTVSRALANWLRGSQFSQTCPEVWRTLSMSSWTKLSISQQL